MTYKSAVKLLLFVFVGVSLAAVIVDGFRGRKESVRADSTSARSSDQNAGRKDRVIAYYFHTTVRCPTCRKIEAFSDEALKAGFGEALANGSLEWKLVNLQEPGNRHFADAYKLFTKSLVIVRFKDRKQAEWKNLEKVWELTDNKQAFVAYVQGEVRDFLRKI